MNLLEQPKPPKVTNARVVKKLNFDEDEPVCRSFPKLTPNDRRGYANRHFTADEVRDMRRRMERYKRLMALFEAKYPRGKGQKSRGRRSLVKAYLFHRYGVDSITYRYGCRRETVYSICLGLSYGDVD